MQTPICSPIEADKGGVRWRASLGCGGGGLGAVGVVGGGSVGLWGQGGRWGFFWGCGGVASSVLGGWGGRFGGWGAGLGFEGIRFGVVWGLGSGFGVFGVEGFRIFWGSGDGDTASASHLGSGGAQIRGLSACGAAAFGGDRTAGLQRPHHNPFTPPAPPLFPPPPRPPQDLPAGADADR